MTNHPHAARIHRRIDLLLIAITIAILVLIACTARATDSSWNGSGTNWGTNANWTNNKPGNNDNALFDNLFTGTNQPNVSNETTGGIWMRSNVTRSVTISGSGLTINGNTINGIAGRGILLDNSSFTLTVSASMTLGGAQTWQNDSTTPATSLTVSGTVNLGGNALTVAGAGNTLMSGVVSGAGAITNNGAGTLTLSGANTYSGSTTISGGTLNANGGASQALGGASGVTVNGGGTLLLSSSNQINNSATMTLNGGTLRLAGVSEGTAGTAGLGALTLSAAAGVTSTIDFSGASGIIQFGGIAQTNNGSLLDITNWNGSLGGGGAERLLFSGNTSSFTSIFTQSEVLFGGVAGYTAIQFSGFYEITPVPEPSTWIGGALAVGVLGWSQRRRFARLINPAA